MKSRNVILLFALFTVLAMALLYGGRSAQAETTYTISDRIALSGLEATNETWTAAPNDFNHDLITDIWIGYHDRGGVLYKGLGQGRFEKVVNTAWPRQLPGSKYVKDRHDCAFGQFMTQTGPMDAYCVTGRSLANFVKNDLVDNELWSQGEPGQFKDIGTPLGLGDPYGRGRGAVVLDANNDGWDDIYVTNDLPRSDDPKASTNLVNNKLFINKAGTGFAAAPQYKMNVKIGHGRCYKTLDINADSLDDVIVCGQSRLYLYVNQGGTSFREMAYSYGITGGYFKDMTVEDYDKDGDLDIIGVNANQVLYHENLLGKYQPRKVLANFVDSGWAIAVADANGDSKNDIYVLRTGTNTNPDDILLMAGLEPLSFSRLAVPSATGSGSDVLPLSIDPLRSAFLVLNGREVFGPNQLIEVTGAP